METLHHRLAAVWFADIVGFTRQAAQDEGRALRIVQAFQEAARDVSRRFEGRIVKFIGDAALAEFSSTESAVRAAIRLGKACLEHASRAGVECPTLRIAVHVGDVTTTEDGDVYGDGVNLAARIVKEVAPGEVWVSEDVWRQLRQRPRFNFQDRGAPELKGLDPVELYAVVGEEGEGEEDQAGFAARSRSFLRELRRRHVYRVAVVYAVVGWLVVQVVADTFPTLGLSTALARAVMVLVVVGFPVALALAWAYEITPQGIRRAGTEPVGTTGRGRARVRQAAVAVALASAVTWFVFGPERPPGEAIGEMSEAALDPSRVAVLYFDERPSGDTLGHLGAGFTESLIDRLRGVRGIEVVSPSGVEPFRGREAPLDSVARALGAGTLVDGSVERAGDRLRVRFRLVDGRDLSTIESWTEERPWSELFSLQGEVVDDIVASLRQRLGERLQVEQRRSEATNVEAWELVERARRLALQARAADNEDPDIASSLRREADEMLARAEALDPRWVEPAIVRAELAAWSRGGDSEARRATYERGIEHAQRALAKSPSHARALAIRGALYDSLATVADDSVEIARHIAAAERDLRRAVASDPRLASAWIALADLLYNDLWELAEARLDARRAYQADAFLLERDHFAWLCEISFQLKDYEEAQHWCAEGRRRFPERATRLLMVELQLLATDGVEPDVVKAWELVGEMQRQDSPDFNVPAAKMVTAAVLVRAGLPDSAQAIITDARRTIPEELAPYLDYLEAYARLRLDQRRESLKLLRSFLGVAPEYRAQLANDHWFEQLAGDATFERLVDRQRRPIFCRLLCEPPDGR